MTYTTKLSQRVLEAVRGRIGVSETDTSRDSVINGMTARSIVRNYFGWRHGDESFGDEAISVIQQAYAIELKEPKL